MAGTYLRAFLAEFIFTTFLAFVVLNVATTKSQDNNSFFGLAIGLAVASGAVCVGEISSAVFNPAVGLGLWFVGSAWDTTWNLCILIYLSAPTLGGALAAGLFRVILPEEVSK